MQCVDQYSPDASQSTICISTLFDNFLKANSFKSILQIYNFICLAFHLESFDNGTFYQRFKTILNTWKAQKLWAILDRRGAQIEYQLHKANFTRVLIIGAGPCGLRAAIECAFLGCKVVVLEKRDRFSRNNVLHLWPYVIQDLKNLGAKQFYPKFCAGSIDHISIRQLQCILLKVALILGVEIYENVAFEEILEPTIENKLGWRARTSPVNHYISTYEFDVVIGADGKRNTLPGFPRKEMRGKLAIGITANFINKKSHAEERVQEISGVACIFHREFFKDLKEQTAIDLENIVYYKDDTHYFVMCAKKQSLLEKGVILKDCEDVSSILSANNVDQQALMNYARTAADYVTEGALPHLDYASNHFGLPDVAMFDFTSLYSAENSTQIYDLCGYRLLMGIVGDSLHEPFWPTGSGIARGFLGVFDTVWMIRQLITDNKSPLESLAERESIYRLLAQTTTENLNQNINKYTLDPRTRYQSLDYKPYFKPEQMRGLYYFDEIDVKGLCILANENDQNLRFTCNRSNFLKVQQLIKWIQFVIAPYRLRIENLTHSLRSGVILCAILNRYRPDLLDYGSINPKAYIDNIDNALAIFLQQWGVQASFSGQHLCNGEVSEETCFEYMNNIREALKTNCDVLYTPNIAQEGPSPQGTLLKNPAKETSYNRLAALNNVYNANYNRLPAKRHLKDDYEITNRCDQIKERQQCPNENDEQQYERHRARIEKLYTLDDATLDYGTRLRSNVSLNDYKSKTSMLVDKLSKERLHNVEKLLKNNVSPKLYEPKSCIKVRKLDQKDIDEMEQKLEDTVMGKLLYKKKPVSMSTQEEKLVKVKTADLRDRAENCFAEDSPKFGDIDNKLHQLEAKLRLPNKSGAVGVAQLLKQHEAQVTSLPSTSVAQQTKTPNSQKEVASKRLPSKPLNLPPETGNPKCCFCGERVYLAERLCAEGLYMHQRCFRCEYCNTALRLGSYGFDRTISSAVAVRDENNTSGAFYCMAHLNLPIGEKLTKLKMLNNKLTLSDVCQFQPSLSTDSICRPQSQNHTPPVPPPKHVCLSSVMSIHKDNNFMRLNQPKTEQFINGLQIASLTNNQISTPERAEFECNVESGTDNASAHTTDETCESGEFVEPCEMEEDLLTEHNLHQDMTDSDSGSNVSLSDSERMDLQEQFNSGRMLNPVKLAVKWQHKRSNEHLIDSESTSSTETESDGEIETIPQRSTPKKLIKVDLPIIGLVKPPEHSDSDCEHDNKLPERDHSYSKIENLSVSIPVQNLLNLTLETPHKIEELERRRAECRARARLKSDDELGYLNNASLPKPHVKITACKSAPTETLQLSNSPFMNKTDSSPLRDRSGFYDTGKAKVAEDVLETDNCKLSANITPKQLMTPSKNVIKMRVKDNSASVAPSGKIKRRSLLSFFGFSSPRDNNSNASESMLNDSSSINATSVNEANIAPDSALDVIEVTIESSKETSLLGKIGRRHRKQQRKSSEDSRHRSAMNSSAVFYVTDLPPTNNQLHAPKATIDELAFGSQESIECVKTVDNEANLKVSDREIRRVERAVAKIARERDNQRLLKAQQIARQLQEVEIQRQQINCDGERIELLLLDKRPTPRVLLIEWLLVCKRRDELDQELKLLHLKARELELETEHSRVQHLFRECTYAAEASGTIDLASEQSLLQQMLQIVQLRDAVVKEIDLLCKNSIGDILIDAILKEKGDDFLNYKPVFKEAVVINDEFESDI